MKANILIVGLLSSGSSALVDFFREYDNINIIPNEFNDFRAPGMVADLLDPSSNVGIKTDIAENTRFRNKVRLIYNVFPVFKFKIVKIKGLKERFKLALIRIKQLILLSKLNRNLSLCTSTEDKIRVANQWIEEIGDINGKNKTFVLFDQPLLTVLDTQIWKEVFRPLKLIIVFRDPRDQLAEIVRNGNLFAPYNAPNLTLSGVILETLYGRSRNAAFQFHVEAIIKRFEWIDSLLNDLEPDSLLLIDFEGLVNNYNKYKVVIENFVGGIKSHHKDQKLYFNPEKAAKNIGIYGEVLNDKEIESLAELKNWYKNRIKTNQILHQAYC